MRPMKTAGINEVRAAKARLLKLYAMERVDRADVDYIGERLMEVEARIINMREISEDGQEVGDV